MAAQTAVSIPSNLVSAFDEELMRSFPNDNLVEAASLKETKDSWKHFCNAYFHLLLGSAELSPFDWKKTDVYSSYIKTLGLDQIMGKYDIADVPEDDDISYAFDHHSLVTSQLPESYDDIVQTADEIIKEINLLMSQDDSALNLSDAWSSSMESSPITPNINTNWVNEQALDNLSLKELNAIFEDLESCVREYSAYLVQELAYRDELDFEQEQKDIFIARLDEMHRRLERRHRRPSMPPDNQIQRMLLPLSLKNDFYFNDPEISPLSDEQQSSPEPVPMSNESSQPQPTSGPQFLSRAQSAASAAVAATSSATIALRRQLKRLSGFTKSFNETGLKLPDILSRRLQPSPDSATAAARTTTTTNESNPLPPTSARAITIARLRKWAGRTSSGTMPPCGPTSSFRALLRRNHDTNATSNDISSSKNGTSSTIGKTGGLSYGREARSAVTTPTSSQIDFPPIPANLTHSASGHLIGQSEMNSEDLEYKYLTTSIPYHRSPNSEGPSVAQLELFNEMLLAILTNNPNLTAMLTDYILNVYAPADHRLSKLPI